MAKPRALIISATGLVGSALYKVFTQKEYPLWGTYRHLKDNNLLYVDITNKESLNDIFVKIKPQVVILTAALTNVDYCEEHPEDAWQINVAGTENVVRLCKEYQAKLFFFSSDYIFDGRNGPYSEEDLPSPISYYGRTKLEAEQIIKNLLQDYLIIRTTVVYGKEKLGKNFVIRFVNNLRKQEKIEVPTDQIGSPTYALNLAEATEELLRRNKVGIYNITGSDLIDRYNFALEICRVFKLNRDLIVPLNSKELNQNAKRPLKAGLKIDKAKNELTTRLLGVKEGLELLKQEI